MCLIKYNKETLQQEIQKQEEISLEYHIDCQVVEKNKYIESGCLTSALNICTYCEYII